MSAPPLRARVAVLAAAAAVACHDAPTAPRPAAPAARPALAVTCRASVSRRTVSCGDGAGVGAANASVSPALVLGGQGVYLLLTSSATAYDAAGGVFSTRVSVHNFTAQQIGTADGVTPSGMTVFFQSGPSVVAGSGAVSVANADGRSAFTASDQPYFSYPQLLQPRDSTPAREWRFSVPASVDDFSFVVYVRTELPAEQGVLRWRPSRTPLTAAALAGAWAASASDVFAVGEGGAIAHYDGTGWSRMSSPVTDALKDVAGRSGSDVFAVGFGGILHYDGTTWSRQLLSGLFQSVWVAPSGVAFAVGRNGEAERFDGSAWVPTATGTSANLYGVWGAGPSDVYAVGDGDVVLHWDGTRWTAGSTGTGSYLRDVWGASGSNLWVATDDGALLHFDGSAWSTAGATAGAALAAVAGGSSSAVYAAGADGAVLRWNGASVAALPKPAIVDVLGLTVLPSGALLAVGEQGTIARYDGARWTVDENASTYTGVWGSGPADVYAASAAGLVSHFDGVRWSFAAAPVVAPLRSVAGFAADRVYAGGDGGALLAFDGSTWSTVRPPTLGAAPLVSLAAPSATVLYAAATADAFDAGNSVLRYAGSSATVIRGGSSAHALWAPDAASLYAAGDSAEVQHWNGSAWSTSLARGSFQALYGAWGTGASDVYAVGDLTIRHWNGAAWSTTAVPDVTLRGVWGSGSADVFAVGDGGTIWHFDGRRWLAQYSGTAFPLTGVWGTSPTSVFAVGANGTILFGGR